LIHPKVLVRHNIEYKFNPNTKKYEIWRNKKLIYSDRCILETEFMMHVFPKRYKLFEKRYFQYRKLMSRIRGKIQNRNRNQN
jgi:hypothetical protein